MRRLSAIPVQYVAAFVLAAVIGGGIYALRSSSAPTNAPSPTSPSASQPPTIVHRPASVNTIAAARPNGEANKSPKQILADAASALRAAGGFELQGAMRQGGQTIRIRLVASPPHSLDLAVATGPAAYEMLRVGAGFYVRGNASFWKQHLGARGALIADRWIHGYNSALASAFAEFAPARVARCMTEDHGTLSLAGTTRINGQPAIVIKDAGNLPGTQAQTLAVATTGEPYPLRATGSGAQRPGGRIDVCNDGHASGSQDGALTFSLFNRVPPLQAPMNAIETASPSPVS